MKKNNSYLVELFALCLDIIHSPMVFYFYLRYKLGFENKRIKLFRIAYTAIIKQPKNEIAQLAQTTIYVILITLIGLAFGSDEFIFDFLAGMIIFTQAVEW